MRLQTCAPRHDHGVIGRGRRKSYKAARNRRRSWIAASAPQYSANIQRVLDSPLLETPEGMTPSRQFAIVEAFWKTMKNEHAEQGSRRTNASKNGSKTPPRPRRPPTVVEAHSGSVVERLPKPSRARSSIESPNEFDVCICGGILGLMLGLSLLLRGQRVCIVEKRTVEGRKQEWNISKHDLDVLVRLGLLTSQEVDSCVVTRWEQDRVAFKGEAIPMYIEGALDLGVDPQRLIGLLKERYLALGGTVLEHHMFQKAHVYDDGVVVELKGFNVGREADWNAGDMNRGASTSSSEDEETRSEVSCRLIVDCMGHYSSIVKQQRYGQAVEGMVIVVGGCMEEKHGHEGREPDPEPEPQQEPQQEREHEAAYKASTKKERNGCDLLVTIDDSQDDMQYFWEAFPAEGGKAKTVYMFAYADAHPERPSMVEIFDTYLSNLERYQGVPLDKIIWKRVLMGGFPCYSKRVPLKPSFDRVIQAGDASAVQSPLSFGGFASMCRHLPRLQRGIVHALEADRLTKKDLALIHPYLPNLAVAWLFQRAMSLKVGQGNKPYISPDHINKLMMCNFRVMKFFGPRVTLPFVQDSFQAVPLGLVMFGMMLRDPITITKVLFQVGIGLVMRWMAHYVCLVAYTLLHIVVRLFRIDRVLTGYRAQRFFDALEWGSGLDGAGGGVGDGGEVHASKEVSGKPSANAAAVYAGS